MAYPTSLPSYAGFTSSHTLSADSHAAQHNQEQTDVIALATKVGTGSSTSTNNTVLRGNGTGTSAWAQVNVATDVTGTLAVANGGTGVTSSTGTGSTVLGTSPTLATPAISNPTITGGGSWTGSPTISTPTIASLTNAQHDHTNAAGGGTLGTNTVGSSQITNASVNDADLVYGKVRTRQGGSATDWSSQGTTTYDYSGSNTFIQVGKKNVAADPTTVTFPTAFNQVPLVVFSTGSATSNNSYTVLISSSATQFTCRQLNDTGAVTTTEAVNWIAIGE